MRDWRWSIELCIYFFVVRVSNVKPDPRDSDPRDLPLVNSGLVLDPVNSFVNLAYSISPALRKCLGK